MIRRTAKEPDNTAGGAASIFTVGFWRDKAQKTMASLYAAIQALAREESVTQSGGTPDGVTDSAVEAELNARAETLAAEITNSTFKALQKVMNEATSTEEMAAGVRKVFDDARSRRSHIIAVTEVAGALNHALYYYISGLIPEHRPNERKWVTMHDSKVRMAHREADGQIRSMQEPFSIGGFPARFPGDPQLPPELSINCRCHLVYGHGPMGLS